MEKTIFKNGLIIEEQVNFFDLDFPKSLYY